MEVWYKTAEHSLPLPPPLPLSRLKWQNPLIFNHKFAYFGLSCYFVKEFFWPKDVLVDNMMVQAEARVSRGSFFCQPGHLTPPRGDRTTFFQFTNLSGALHILRQPILGVSRHPSSPSSSFVTFWLTAPPPFVILCQHLPDPPLLIRYYDKHFLTWWNEVFSFVLDLYTYCVAWL